MATADVLGVRFPTASHVAWFRTTDASIPAGAWVAVPDGSGATVGQVVISPCKVIAFPEVADLPLVERVVHSSEVEAMLGELPAPGPGEASGEGRRLGGIGPVRYKRPDHSGEDDRFRAAKADLPTLGQRVTTPGGTGMVVALDFGERQVRVRLDTDGRDASFPAATIDMV